MLGRKPPVERGAAGPGGDEEARALLLVVVPFEAEIGVGEGGEFLRGAFRQRLVRAGRGRERQGGQEGAGREAARVGTAARERGEAFVQAVQGLAPCEGQAQGVGEKGGGVHGGHPGRKGRLRPGCAPGVNEA